MIVSTPTVPMNVSRPRSGMNDDDVATSAAERAVLQDFVENATVGLHSVGPDGVILWANRAELELLGYEADEYVGRSIAEFHFDQDLVKDILARLTRGE